MPANPKYLTKSKSQRFAKTSAAIVGSLLVTGGSMLAISVWFELPKTVYMTYAYGFFLVWCTLMLLAFLFKNGWKCWLIYGTLSVIFFITYYLGSV
ncbi:MAG: hypothetical protein AAGC64_13450 [Bacteroidota bacterium]